MCNLVADTLVLLEWKAVLASAGRQQEGWRNLKFLSDMTVKPLLLLLCECFVEDGLGKRFVLIDIAHLVQHVVLIGSLK